MRRARASILGITIIILVSGVGLIIWLRSRPSVEKIEPCQVGRACRYYER
jgi:hypothetical protein